MSESVRTEIVYYVASSLDGFIATPDGGVEWLSEFEGSGEDYGYADFLAGIDGILIGRTTYDQVLGFGDWPYAGKPTWVFTHRELSDPPTGVTATSDSPAEFATGLGAADVRRAWLVGGGELAGSFARAGLITRYIVSVMPVLLGDGVRLLGTHGGVERLRLESSTRIGEVVQNTYVTPERTDNLATGGS